MKPRKPPGKVRSSGRVVPRPKTPTSSGRWVWLADDGFGSPPSLFDSATAFATNSFCPTGKGGGVDPTCGAGGKRKTGRLADGTKIEYVPHDSARNRSASYATVLVDPKKLDSAWRAADPGYHVPAGGGGAEIPGRRSGFERFLATGKPIQAPKVYVDETGRVVFEDGRHRFSVLRDRGASAVAVTVPRSSAARVSRLFGVEPTPSKKRKA